MMHSSPLRDDRFIVMDVSTARAIADALRTAGTRAGATGDVAARGDASSAATLAATCHEKMRFDFPSVRAREVRALARAMRDRLREDDVGEATREFPVTTALARNCAEEASREMARASELGGGGGDADADEATPTKDDDDDESVEARAKAYASLCVVVFVEFPRRVLAMGDEDAFEALRAYSPGRARNRRIDEGRRRRRDDDERCERCQILDAQSGSPGRRGRLGTSGDDRDVV